VLFTGKSVASILFPFSHLIPDSPGQLRLFTRHPIQRLQSCHPFCCPTSACCHPPRATHRIPQHLLLHTRLFQTEGFTPIPLESLTSSDNPPTDMTPSTPQPQPQAYGATPSSSRTQRSRQVSRRTPRRSMPPTPPEAPEGQATVVSSVSNLANTIIGAGALAFPSAFASMGLIPGILSCAFSACTSIFGLYLLSRCATMVGKKPGQETTKASFNEVAKMTFGKGWATRLFDVRPDSSVDEQS